MEVRFKNPELQAKVDQWVKDTGLPVEELIEDAMAGYFDETTQVRETLDRRYDEVESGKVKLLNGEEAFARLRAKSEARRQNGT